MDPTVSGDQSAMRVDQDCPQRIVRYSRLRSGSPKRLNFGSPPQIFQANGESDSEIYEESDSSGLSSHDSVVQNYSSDELLNNIHSLNSVDQSAHSQSPQVLAKTEDEVTRTKSSGLNDQNTSFGIEQKNSILAKIRDAIAKKIESRAKKGFKPTVRSSKKSYRKNLHGSIDLI